MDLRQCAFLKCDKGVTPSISGRRGGVRSSPNDPVSQAAQERAPESARAHGRPARRVDGCCGRLSPFGSRDRHGRHGRHGADLAVFGVEYRLAPPRARPVVARPPGRSRVVLLSTAPLRPELRLTYANRPRSSWSPRAGARARAHSDELGHPPSFTRAQRRVLEDRAGTDVEYELDCNRGRPFLQSRVVSEVDGTGEISGVLVVTGDLSDRRRAKDALAEQADDEGVAEILTGARCRPSSSTGTPATSTGHSPTTSRGGASRAWCSWRTMRTTPARPACVGRLPDGVAGSATWRVPGPGVGLPLDARRCRPACRRASRRARRL